MSAGALIARFGKPLTVTRYAAGSYSNGNYVNGATSTFSIIMSVQPINGRELIYLPEGQRTRQFLTGYTETLLQTANQEAGTKADVVAYNGRNYEVQRVEYWESTGNTIQTYCKDLLAEMNP